MAFYDEKKNIALIEGSSATGKQVMMENQSASNYEKKSEYTLGF